MSVYVEGVFVTNASGAGVLTNFQKLLDLGLCLEDAAGNSLADTRFNLVLGVLVNKTTSECKLFVNLPTGSYNNDLDAYNDVDQTAVVTVPRVIYNTAILVARVPVRHRSTGGGTFEFINPVGRPQIIDLRGNLIGQSGSGASGVTQEFSDANFRVFDDGDASKKIAMEASAITASTTRTISMPDRDVDLADAKDARNMMSTGLIKGGNISATPGGTTYNVGQGNGLFVNNSTDPDAPVKTPVSWSADTGRAVPDIATETWTYVGINSSGIIVEQHTPFTTTQDRDIFQLGVIRHVGSTVDSAHSVPNLATSVYNTVLDIARAMGLLNISGNVYSANGANLNIDKGAGQTFGLGINYDASVKNPNYTTDGSGSAVTFARTYKDGSGGFTYTAGQTSVDPEQYDDGDGVLGTVPNGTPWQVKRIYYVPVVDEHYVTYGQATYKSYEEAYASRLIENPDVPPLLSDIGSLRSFLIVKKGATALNDILQAEFIPVGSGASGGGAAGPSSTFQTVYENSVQAQIALNATLGSLQLQNATGTASSLLLQLLDSIGNEVVGFTGEGQGHFGDGALHTITGTKDILNLYVGGVSGGGIKFWESNDFSMGLQYYGVGSGAANQLAIIDELEADLVRFRKDGSIGMAELATAPPLDANMGYIYVKASDGHLYFKDSSGTETDLTTGGGGGSPGVYHSGEDTQDTTTSTSYVESFKYTSPTLAIGFYQVAFSCEVGSNGNTDNYMAGARVQLDDTETLGEINTPGVFASDGYATFAGVYWLDNDVAAPVEIDFDIKTNNAIYAAKIRNKVVHIIPVTELT
jgi:hypothetical protein